MRPFFKHLTLLTMALACASSWASSDPSFIKIQPGQSVIVGQTVVGCGNGSEQLPLSLVAPNAVNAPTPSPSGTPLVRCIVDTLPRHREAVFIKGSRTYSRRKKDDPPAYDKAIEYRNLAECLVISVPPTDTELKAEIVQDSQRRP